MPPTTNADPSLALVLHAHLPWVRQPDDVDEIEERWLFEAVIECYLPLVASLERLDRDGVPGALALSVSPTLAAMLRDDAMTARFEEHFTKLEALLPAARARLSADLHPALEHHAARLREARARWESLGDPGLLGAFASLRRSGRLSLWTCAHPHPLLPLWADRPWFLDASLSRAISLHRKEFGADPDGLWLPECGYAQGLDAHLSRHGVRVSVLETHGVLHGAPRPAMGVGALVRSPAGVCFGGRDPHAASAVWSRSEGYPGEAPHQDFASDLGAGPWEGFTSADGHALRTGLGVFAVTDRRGGAKRPYDPAAARRLAAAQAEHFVGERLRGAGLSVAPFDAELFGHWWAEGPVFLEEVLRASAARGLRCVALDRTAREHGPAAQRITPADSTWGRGGHLAAWLDGPAAPMARELDAMARALEAAGVESSPAALDALLSASASDWPFLLNGGGAPHYAQRRFDAHRDAFWRALRSEVARPG